MQKIVLDELVSSIQLLDSHTSSCLEGLSSVSILVSRQSESVTLLRESVELLECHVSSLSDKVERDGFSFQTLARSQGCHCYCDENLQTPLFLFTLASFYIALFVINMYSLITLGIDPAGIWEQQTSDSNELSVLVSVKWGLRIAEGLFLAGTIIIMPHNAQKDESKRGTIVQFVKYVGILCSSVLALDASQRCGYVQSADMPHSIDSGGLFQSILLAICIAFLCACRWLSPKAHSIIIATSILGIAAQAIRLVAGIWLIIFGENRMLTQLLLSASFLFQALFLLLWLCADRLIHQLGQRSVCNARDQSSLRTHPSSPTLQLSACDRFFLPAPYRSLVPAYR